MGALPAMKGCPPPPVSPCSPHISWRILGHIRNYYKRIEYRMVNIEHLCFAVYLSISGNSSCATALNCRRRHCRPRRLPWSSPASFEHTRSSGTLGGAGPEDGSSAEGQEADDERSELVEPDPQLLMDQEGTRCGCLSVNLVHVFRRACHST